MKYYIVFNEWKYPQESGREYIGDYDTRDEAQFAARTEYETEYENFLDVNKGECYREACGCIVDEDFNCMGYSLHSSSVKSRDMFFKSIIIEREV